MNAGSVVQLVGAWAQYPQTKNADISGSVLNADQSIQVISFNAIAELPDYSVANADHMEETVLPSEVIARSTSSFHRRHHSGTRSATSCASKATSTGRTSRTRKANRWERRKRGRHGAGPSAAGGQPAPDCLSLPGHCVQADPFIVEEADQPFAVASFMVGGTLQMPGTNATNSQGDPSMTMAVTPEQFRKDYTFLAPADHLENFADILVPKGATVILDGAAGAGSYAYRERRLGLPSREADPQKRRRPYSVHDVRERIGTAGRGLRLCDLLLLSRWLVSRWLEPQPLLAAANHSVAIRLLADEGFLCDVLGITEVYRQSNCELEQMAAVTQVENLSRTTRSVKTTLHEPSEMAGGPNHYA